MATTSSSSSSASQAVAATSATDLEQASKDMLSLIARQTVGITITEIRETLGLSDESIVQAGNILLKQGRVELSQRRDGEFVYHQSNPEETAKFRGLAPEEMMIFQLIDKEGDLGIWLRELRNKSGFQTPQVNKIIKTLESRKLIKSVTSITGKNKKLYMRYDIEPSKEITGGAWYTDAEFDSEFIQQLNETCFIIICSHGMMSVEEVAQELRKTNIARVELKVDDIQMILDTLIFDGKVEEIPLSKGRKGYKPSKLQPRRNGYTAIPCGMCPVASLCSDEGDITPTKCKYYKAWLEL